MYRIQARDNGSEPATSFPTISYLSTEVVPQPSNDSTGSTTRSASPPLILAFLAIGLFTAAMIIMFGCRRFHLGQRWVAERRDGEDSELEAQERPQLWDMSTVPVFISSNIKWEEIMPVAAQLAPDIPSEDKTGRVRRTRRGVFGLLLRGFDYAQWRRHSSTIPQTPELLKSRLHVAIPIAMPSPQARQLDSDVASLSAAAKDDEKAGITTEARIDDRLVYSIGVIELEVPLQ